MARRRLYRSKSNGGREQGTLYGATTHRMEDQETGAAAVGEHAGLADGRADQQSADKRDVDDKDERSRDSSRSVCNFAGPRRSDAWFGYMIPRDRDRRRIRRSHSRDRDRRFVLQSFIVYIFTSNIHRRSRRRSRSGSRSRGGRDRDRKR